MTLAILAVGFPQEIPSVVVKKGKPCHQKVSECFNDIPYFLELDQLQVKRESVITGCKKCFYRGKVSNLRLKELLQSKTKCFIGRSDRLLLGPRAGASWMKGSLIWRPKHEMNFGRSGTNYIDILFVIWFFSPHLFFAKVFQSSECLQALQKTKWLR